MNILATIAISAIATLASAFGLYNYLPLSFIEQQKETNLGATITTINGSDTLSSSRAVINTNFTNLNNDKIEATQTTLNSLTSATSLASLPALATVGTITSGTWHGSTVTVPWGGTGSTTLASNQVLLGNGTGNVSVVSGTGTSGQFLTSNGAGNAPAWSTGAIDEAANYTWTGLHTFSATTTITANSATNNALTLNGINYAFPSTQGASSTALSTNGSGVLSWSTQNKLLYSNLSPTTVTNTASTTIFSTTIPANTLNTGNSIIVDLYFDSTGSNRLIQANGVSYFDFGYGYATTTLSYSDTTNNRDFGGGYMRYIISANGTTNSQKVIVDGAATSPSLQTTYSPTIYFNKSKTISVDSTQAQNVSLVMRFTTFNTYGAGFYKVLIYTLAQ